MTKKIFNFQFSIFKPKKQAGVTLFIAVTIMGILLLITFAIANIALKSTLFASSGRDSQYAFYAADAGIECVLYWDNKHPTNGSAFATSTSGSPINCSGKTISNSQAILGTTTLTRIGGGGPSNPTSIFGFVMDQTGQGDNPVSHCAIVTVTKNTDGSTYIKSRGYNTCDTSNPRRVERGLEVNY